jgi:microsomal dipeptidase-like Zn-dependent dipeptidase
MNTIIADLHCHSTFFPHNDKGRKTIWHQHRNLIYPSQGDFVKLAKGGTRILFLTLYPIEQGFLSCKLLGLGTGNIADRLARFVLNMPKSGADAVQDYAHDYFADLLDEYKFLIDSPSSEEVRLGSSGGTKVFNFKLVSNYDELKNVLSIDNNFDYGSSTDDTIAVIPTIEGAHSLGTGQKNTLYSSGFHDSVIKNIRELKKMGPADQPGLYCPFFITLCHFFWNQIGGHAVSLWNFPGLIFDQNAAINNDIELPFARRVVDELLSKEEGKRILIDVAHMSVKVRKWYYHDYLPKRKLETGETIPVIVSHTGVNGCKDLTQSQIPGSPDVVHKNADKLYHKSKTFNPWDVFLSDEEILLIHDSGGLIGLALDKRIMMGRKALKTVKWKAMFRFPSKKREIWIEPFIEEIIHIAQTIYNRASNENKNTIWDNICIGSDYDGMIHPINAYRNATHFPELYKNLYEGLKRRSSVVFLSRATDTEIREITDKIVWKNALQFLQKHFV